MQSAVGGIRLGDGTGSEGHVCETLAENVTYVYNQGCLLVGDGRGGSTRRKFWQR